MGGIKHTIEVVEDKLKGEKRKERESLDTEEGAREDAQEESGEVYKI